MGKWEKLKKGKLENNANVVSSSSREQYLHNKLDEMG